MADFQINIEGIPQLVAKLGRATASDTLRKAMTNARKRVQATLQKYPSPPGGSTYVRTGDLGRAWTGRTLMGSGGPVGEIGNAVKSRKTGRPYSRYVQADTSEPSPHQTGQHSATGWITDVQAFDQNRSAIEGDFREAIDDALGR